MKWWDWMPSSSFIWMLGFKPAFSLTSFTIIKRLFNSSLLSAIRVVSPAYLKLLVFLPQTLIPACASSSLAFCMMCSAYKLNKQDDNIQPWCTPFSIFFSFVFISWRLITLQYCSGFCHTLTWISHGFTCVPHPDPRSRLALHPIPLGLPRSPAQRTFQKLLLMVLFTIEWDFEFDGFTFKLAWNFLNCVVAATSQGNGRSEFWNRICYNVTAQ